MALYGVGRAYSFPYPRMIITEELLRSASNYNDFVEHISANESLRAYVCAQ